MEKEKDKPFYIKDFYTLEQLSNDLGISTQSLRKFIKDGDLIASKVATRYVVKREDVIKWLDKNKA